MLLNSNKCISQFFYYAIIYRQQNYKEMTNTNKITEPSFYHNSKLKGTFSVLQMIDGEKKQRTYLLKDLDKALENLRASETDTWICQNDFNRFNRRLVNLERINLVFSDIDTYNSAYKDVDEEVICRVLKNFLEQKGYPQPSIMVFSGRGIQIKWLLKQSLEAKDLPMWKKVQLAICEKLKSFGADSNALDASRLLRLEGTKNTKSGKYARVIQPCANPARYTFEQLVEKFDIDLTEDEQEVKVKKEKVIVIKEKVVKESPFRPYVISSSKINNPLGNKKNLKKKSFKNLAWCRLLDLRTLADIREGVKEGNRMTFLFWSLNFMACSLQINALNFWKEAEALAQRFYPNGDYNLKDLNTIYEKVCKSQKGETVTYDGKKYTTLYTPTNKTLISIFQITADEQKKMITIIDEHEKKERHRVKESQRRRSMGAKSHKESDAQTKPWEALNISRRTYYRNIDKYRTVEFEGVLHQA